ncbi:hypothetical protein [Klebsiella pneumoniae]|uniref:hypothetical protein n=1 Tax=Klebsiella pneumoniae TaxID=573 RepID=UPI0009CD2549|nr:hypothetical protein [Klebsiella pneumoniae]SLR74391.1 RelE family toxin-antitoxin system [Klebsiella pneumoniae]SLR82616.1 RelE family toxin-antitoxin system [Klebsiella pneumoniae]SLR86246.1 RelE family toxin-antitoxin system [Klebsiella pneumoniae]SLR90724.1 RelE family toxin-antitoxin system [Klebsiella pneumoniae]
MTTNITELAQSHELLIANGQQTADLLRHLADNEIDSDYFAVVSECESYGKETDAELSITEFALRAAGYVDELVEALEKAQQRNGELETYSKTALEFREAARDENRHLKLELEIAEKRIAELESRTVKLPDLRQIVSGDRYVWSDGVYNYSQDVKVALAAAGIKVEAE